MGTLKMRSLRASPASNNARRQPQLLHLLRPPHRRRLTCACCPNNKRQFVHPPAPGPVHLAPTPTAARNPARYVAHLAPPIEAVNVPAVPNSVRVTNIGPHRPVPCRPGTSSRLAPQ